MDPIDLAELTLSVPEIDPDKPSPARVYDYWLGGSNNFAADREVARRTEEAMPHVPAAARANRAFLRHVVHHLVAEQGITQLLDLGSGIPTAGNVHEIARSADPAAKVVYVDMDPVAIAHARLLLADVPGVVPILADLRLPDTVLNHPLLLDTIDLSRPVAVMMFAVLHFIPDDQAIAIVDAFLDAAAPGSFLALSHGIPDRDAPATGLAVARDYAAKTGVNYFARTEDEIGAWLTGLEIQPPGIVPIDLWRPEPGIEPLANPLACAVLAAKTA